MWFRSSPDVWLLRTLPEMARSAGPFSAWRDARNGLIAISGQIGLRDGQLVRGGFEPELIQTLANLKAVLEDAGLTPANVVKVNVFLAEIADWPALNRPYAEFFGEELPARTALAVAALPFGARVELEAWAAR